MRATFEHAERFPNRGHKSTPQVPLLSPGLCTKAAAPAVPWLPAHRCQLPSRWQCAGSRGTLLLRRAHQLRQAQSHPNCQPGEANWGDRAVGDPLSPECGFPAGQGQGQAAQLPSSAHPCKSHCAPQRWRRVCFSLSPRMQTCRGVSGCRGKELHHNPPAAPLAWQGIPGEGSLSWAERFSHICCTDK